MASDSDIFRKLANPGFGRQLVGGFGIAFGLLGIFCPVMLLTEYRRISPDFSQIGSGLTPCFVAIVGHICLVVSGVRLFLRRRERWLAYFFGIEVLYSSYILLMSLLAPRTGPAEHAYIRWITDVSLGFFAQIAFGFPLWGWYLLRR
jgi:hypothetical protein